MNFAPFKAYLYDDPDSYDGVMDLTPVFDPASQYSPTELTGPHAGELWDLWIDKGLVRQHPEAAFFAYKSGWRDFDGQPRRGCGLIGISPSVAPGDAFDWTPQTVTLDEPALADLLMSVASMPAARGTDSAGVHHRLWVLDQTMIVNTMVELAASLPKAKKRLVAISPDNTSAPGGFVLLEPGQ